jgi:hypothetical protein
MFVQLFIVCVCLHLVTLCQNYSVRIFRTMLSRSTNFSSQISKASYLGHIALMGKFSIYSVELELRDRKACFAHLR